MWLELRSADRELTELGAGDYLVTLYAPCTEYPRGYVDVDVRGAHGRVRPLYSGTLDTLPTAIRGDFRRSIHREALESVLAQWTPTALSLLGHTRYGQCMSWCRAYACPVPEHSTAQQAG